MLGKFFYDFFCRPLTFFKNSFRNTIRESNSLDLDQDRHCVGPDLGPNCLQRLSADDKSSLAGSVKGSTLNPNVIIVNQGQQELQHKTILF